MFKYRILLFLMIGLLSSCISTKQHIADTDITYVRANEDVNVGSKAIDDMISPYRDQMEDEMNIELGEMPVTLKKGKLNSSMGNWFCDALLVMSNKYSDKPVDFALQNYGGLRIPSISKGIVTKRHIFELMPFDNKLVVLEIDGKTVQMMADNMADHGGAPVSLGLSFTIEEDKAIDVMVNGKPIKSNSTYRVGLPDYVANGGDDSWFLKEIPQFDTGVYIREVMIEYLMDLKAAGKPIIVDKTKRITS
ncbi:5'-nucleotidase C-terminal domain-containing protein [bacterium]|nr:5'-nucleotidase C-terminal domain-containing protein [bacterium]